MESLLFPPEAEAEQANPTVAEALAATEKTVEWARTFKSAFEGHFRPGK